MVEKNVTYRETVSKEVNGGTLKSNDTPLI